MSRYWSDFVHQLQPYVPGEQPPEGSRLVKLNTNENPYPPSPRVLEAIRAGLDERLRLYPDPESVDLRAAIGEYHGVPAEQVFVGNGSDEVLGHVFNALFRHSQPILFPEITYSFYTVYCGLYGVVYRQIPLASDYRIDISDYSGPNGGVILANPNAPTGLLLTLAEIADLVARSQDSVVVVDEAYIDFGGDSAVALVDQYPNLLVVQTLSKSRSLAGLRVGYAIGQRPLVEALERVKNSFNSYPLDALAQLGAVAALEDQRYFEETCARVILGRESMSVALAELGFQVLPSAANFVFTCHPGWGGERLCRLLRERGVVVRHFARQGIERYLRITIGTPAQQDRLLAALRNILEHVEPG